jgi:hypothetical protein
MNSKLFSVLKIVAIAMLITWAVSGPTQALAGPNCNYGCQQGCIQAVSQCAENCYSQNGYGGTYCNPQAQPNCLQNCTGKCNSTLMVCLGACGCL